jgi:hypothetical protein
MERKLEIQRHLVACTSHVTKDDTICLSEEEGLVAHEYEEGYFVHVPDAACDDELRGIGYSPAFLGLLKLARENACDYLTLDRDGPEIDGLERFDW